MHSYTCLSVESWSLVNTIGTAFPARKKHSSVLCPNTGLIYTYGGTSASILGDMWRFNTSNSAWSSVSFTGTSFPSARKGHSAVLDASGVLMYVIAGQAASLNTFTDVWRFNITSG